MTGKRDCECPRARHQHGTRGAYQKDGCRCFPCRIASSHADKRVREGGTRADPGIYSHRCGVTRRLQALHVLGWSETDLAARLGVSKQAVRDLRTHRSDKVLTTTLGVVAALYDELWSRPADGRYAARTRNWAARNGWVPPLGWDDDLIDDPSASPSMPADRPEKRRLAECGTTAAYRRHLRRGDKPCRDCAAAEARRGQDQRKAA